MTKREFFKWLETTSPPREITIVVGSFGCNIFCGTGPPMYNGSLAHSRSCLLNWTRDKKTADLQVAKHGRWLAEFERKKNNEHD